MNNTVNMKSILERKMTIECLYGSITPTVDSNFGYFHFHTAPISTWESQDCYLDFGTNITVASLYNGFAVYPTSADNTSVSKTGLFVGSGTTQPTQNDVGLESPITSGLSFSSNTKKLLLDKNDNPYLSVKATVTNTSNANIQISEIGMFISAYATNLYTEYKGTTKVSTYSRLILPILLDRVVLDEPIVLPSGEAAVIEYNLTIDASNMM